MKLQVLDYISQATGIMSHPHYVNLPTSQWEGYSHYDPHVPWELLSLIISWSPCTFPTLRGSCPKPRSEEDRFNQLPEGIQHQIFSMVNLIATLNRFDHVYNILRNSDQMEIYIDHQPC